jgi:hypothetical protein
MERAIVRVSPQEFLREIRHVMPLELMNVAASQ